MAKTTGKGRVSLKRIQIDKANTTMVVSIAVAAFVVVFSLVASRALWVKQSFQNRLITEKEKAVAQLDENLNTIDELTTSYQAFVDTPENVIGGNPNGTGDQDGDNAKITLDALPSKYDFPALATSLESILKQNYSGISISGEDEEVSQSMQQSSEPVEVPFEVTATGDVNSIEKLLTVFDRSIRPMDITELTINGSNSQLDAIIKANTYYQPEKSFQLQKKVIK